MKQCKHRDELGYPCGYNVQLVKEKNGQLEYFGANGQKLDLDENGEPIGVVRLARYTLVHSEYCYYHNKLMAGLFDTEPIKDKRYGRDGKSPAQWGNIF